MKIKKTKKIWDIKSSYIKKTYQIKIKYHLIRKKIFKLERELDKLCLILTKIKKNIPA